MRSPPEPIRAGIVKKRCTPRWYHAVICSSTFFTSTCREPIWENQLCILYKGENFIRFFSIIPVISTDFSSRKLHAMSFCMVETTIVNGSVLYSAMYAIEISRIELVPSSIAKMKSSFSFILMYTLVLISLRI